MSDLRRPAAETSSSRPPATAAASLRPVVLVTGAARRIGRVIALDLAHAGFDIALHHRGTEPPSFDDAEATAADLRATGATVEVFAADFGDPAATAALVPAIAARFGRLDAVVNSASRFEYDSPATFDARCWSP